MTKPAVQPEFSIVIPTFRRPAQLRQALESIAAQGNINLEVFVVDDSPEYSAYEIVDKFADARVTYIRNPKPTNGVPSLVRNMGLQRCRAPYVHFLDDDDIIPLGYYDQLRIEIRQHNQVGVIFGKVEPFGDCSADQLGREQAFFQSAARRARNSERLRTVWPFVGQMLFGQVLLVCSAAILKRECVEAVGGFDPNIVLHEDRDLFIRVMRKFGAHFVDRVSINYRIGYPSLMHASVPSAEQLILEREGNKLLKKNYITKYGPIEYYALAFMTKIFNKIS